MDVISFSEAATANSRIEIINANPDSSSGIVTVPKVITSGETITIPAGRVAILPNVQIGGVLNVEGEVFIPSGATLSGVVEKVTSTDNAIVRFDGTDGKVQNSGVVIDDNGNVGIGTSISTYGKLNVQGKVVVNCSSGETLSTRGLSFHVDGVKFGNLAVDDYANLLYVGGGLGYGIGAGGTVTQLTSKSTAVTFNKPTGQVIMNNAALAAGASTQFQLTNSLITSSDVININAYNNLNYRVESVYTTNGAAGIRVTNITASALSEALILTYTILKGAIS